MFGFRYARLFKSRWSALLWSAGILFGAWSFASDQPGNEGAEDAANDVQMAAIVNAL